MSKQVYVDCNRANCDDKDSETTNIWNYKLSQELLLNPGTQVSISQSFINQKGINGASIEIEQDFTEVMNFFFYLTDTLHPIPKKSTTAPLFNNCFKTFRYDKMLSLTADPITAGELAGADLFGGSNTPFVLYKPVTIDGVVFIEPVMREKRFFVKKGIYGINQLTDNINDQINGIRDLDGNHSMPYQSRVEEGIYRGNLADGGSGLSELITPYNAYAVNSSGGILTDAIITGLTAGHVFIPIDRHRALLESNKNLDGIPRLNWNDYNSDDAVKEGPFAILLDNQTVAPAGDADILNYNLGTKKYAIGTTEFKIDYNSVNNGYSLNNLHQSYRIPTLDRKSNQNVNEGQPAILTRSPISTGLTREDDATQNKIFSTLSTPITRYGGVIVHNFSVLKSVEDSNRPDTRQNNNYNTYNELFNNDEKAKKTWKKTIWNRLGFSYEQLNDTSQFERFKFYDRDFDPSLHLGGITTDALVDLSSYNQLSCKTNPYVMAHAKTNDIMGGFASYSFIPSNTPRHSVEVAYADNNNVTSYDGSPYSSSTVVNVLTSGRPLIAQNLPSLSTHGYYLITSNCVPNYNDILGKGTPLPLLGVVPKSSLSNQDFIESTNDIINTITNPIVINSIKINILNPDLTNPILAENSSVIIKFEIPEVENAK